MPVLLVLANTKILTVPNTTPITTATVKRQIIRWSGNSKVPHTCLDTLATEEPLEIRLRWQNEDTLQNEDQWHEEPLTITMRTPGQDFELTAGLLYSEGIVRQRSHLKSLQRGDNDNTVVAELAPGHQLDLKRYQRHFYSTSSCGVCGKMAIESLSLLFQPTLVAKKPILAAELLQQLPAHSRSTQTLFEQTGGVHAAALFTTRGELVLLREDIGRHNALDKLLGAHFLADTLNMDDKILLVSGRAGFEIVQKALSANIAFLAAVGAPTALAVEMAEAYNMTLAGFLKDDGFNIYSGAERIL